MTLSNTSCTAQGGSGGVGEPSDELLPCPFCKSIDLFVEREDFTSSYVMCNACGARGPSECQDSDDEETPGETAARRIWNLRASQPASSQERIREMESEVRQLRIDNARLRDENICAALSRKDAL